MMNNVNLQELKTSQTYFVVRLFVTEWSHANPQNMQYPVKKSKDEVLHRSVFFSQGYELVV